MDEKAVDTLGNMPNVTLFCLILTPFFFFNRAEKDRASFMAFYRKNFPQATVLPKMHILEDHTIPWLRRWHVGAGLMGKQGAESIHAHMGRLEAQYYRIVDPLDRL